MLIARTDARGVVGLEETIRRANLYIEAGADAIVAQDGFEVNRLRLLVGEKTLLGAVVMGDQTLSFPLEKIISNAIDITPIRDHLLTPNTNIADVVARFWMKTAQRTL